MPTSYTLVTLNDSPEKAKPLIEKLTSVLGDKYTIDYVGNAESPSGVKALIEKHNPDVLFIASSFTETQANEAISDAKSVKTDIKTFVVPHGLQADKGPGAVVEYVSQNLPATLDG